VNRLVHAARARPAAHIGYPKDEGQKHAGEREIADYRAADRDGPVIGAQTATPSSGANFTELKSWSDIYR